MAEPIDFVQRSSPPALREPEAGGIPNLAAVRSLYPGIDERRYLEALEVICCAVAAKVTIADQVGELVKRPPVVAVFRNLLELAGVLGKLRFESLSSFSRELGSINAGHVSEKPPSLWRLFRSIGNADVRRGLGLIVRTTEALGRAAR